MKIISKNLRWKNKYKNKENLKYIVLYNYWQKKKWRKEIIKTYKLQSQNLEEKNSKSLKKEIKKKKIFFFQKWWEQLLMKKKKIVFGCEFGVKNIKNSKSKPKHPICFAIKY